MGQFQFIIWFAYWYIQANGFEFEWDTGNETKSATKHGVTIEEVESVFNSKVAAPIGIQVSPIVAEERLCLVGQSILGRMVAIVFTLREGKVRPISSRLANRKEIKVYEKVRKEIERIR